MSDWEGYERIGGELKPYRTVTSSLTGKKYREYGLSRREVLSVKREVAKMRKAGVFEDKKRKKLSPHERAKANWRRARTLFRRRRAQHASSR